MNLIINGSLNKQIKKDKKKFDNVKNNNRNIINNFSYISFSKRSEAVDALISEIQKLLEGGVNPNQISVITPVVDDMLKFSLEESLKKIKLKYLSGNEKLIQRRVIIANDRKSYNFAKNNLS